MAIYRKTLLTRVNSKKYINMISAAGYVYIQTGLGTALNGLNGQWYDASNSNDSFTNFQYDSVINNTGVKYAITDGGTPTQNAIVEVYDYRSIAPIIPGQYHKDLCDYAIAIASAKANPEMHNKHLSLWLNNIEKIKNEDADRELIHQIRSEI
jgi:hypothetical protein